MAAPRPTSPARPPVAPVLLASLLAACLYAAFAGGAVGRPEETWLQAGLVVLAVGAAIAWLGPGVLRPAASPWTLGALLALVLFAGWTGLSLAWSVAPDRTWEELNRVLAYALVLALAIAVGAGLPRALERVAPGWLAVAAIVAAYALAGAVAPGIVGHATGVSRLRAPLEYWNALALVCVLGVPVALRLATDRARGAPVRVGALLVLLLVLCTLGMTYSRGGVLALIVAVAVTVAAGGRRLPALAAFAIGVLGAAPVLAFAWTDDRLTANAPPLGEQVDAGLVLGAVLVAAALLVAAAGIVLLRLERRVAWTAARSRAAWLALAAVAIAAAAGWLTVLARSGEGLGGSLERLVDDVTQERRDPTFEPGRLLTTSSGNRVAWWREAGGAWADEPLLGWGAGSFGISRRLYRVAPGDVRQPHSTPMQFLAETGTPGALLGLGAIGLLLAGGVARVRELGPGHERDLAGALLAAGTAWAAHGLVDWDWDIPGVTVPALLLLGVLGARRAAPTTDEEPRPGRVLGLAAACLAGALVLASALLPALSDLRTDAAYRGAAVRTPERLEDAAADAALAARLDPLSVRPLVAAAAVAEGRGRLLEARGHLLDAVERQPWSVEAWRRLTLVAIRLADREGAQRAAARTLQLDPGNAATVAFARQVQGLLGPPQQSPTATGTPLPTAPPGR